MGCREQVSELKKSKLIDAIEYLLTEIRGGGEVDCLSQTDYAITAELVHPEDHKIDINEEFDRLWNIYPKRNGLRVGKGEAKKYFKTHFKSKKKRDLLEKAIINYTAVDVFPRDMKRFMLNDFYMDFLEAAKDQGMTYEAVVKHCADNDLKPIGEHYAMADDTLWYPIVREN